MKKIILLLLIILVSCTTVTNANLNNKKERTLLGYIKDSEDNMVLLLNTEVYLTTVNNKLKDELISVATKEITKYHILLDSHHNYKDENNNDIINIKTLNESIDKGPIAVDPLLIDALEEAITLTKLTKGYFNISLGNLSLLYNDKLLPYDSFNTDPNIKDINDSLKGIIPFEKIDDFIIVNKNNNTIELKSTSNKYSLDLGAFSKGYILNKVYNELIKYNTPFLLNAGSSSIVGYNAGKENITWTIGIKDPEEMDGQLYSFHLYNNSISTSGDYESYYYLEDGTKRHHILNPNTGYSENYYRSNTIISSDAGIIDALSTALFNINDMNEAKEIISNIEYYYQINISYLYIKDGYDIIMDKNFDKLLIKEATSNKISSTTIEK